MSEGAILSSWSWVVIASRWTVGWEMRTQDRVIEGVVSSICWWTLSSRRQDVLVIPLGTLVTDDKGSWDGDYRRSWGVFYVLAVSRRSSLCSRSLGTRSSYISFTDGQVLRDGTLGISSYLRWLMLSRVYLPELKQAIQPCGYWWLLWVSCLPQNRTIAMGWLLLLM